MIRALPMNARTKYVHDLYRQQGFLTWPHIIDNGYVGYGSFRAMLRHLFRQSLTGDPVQVCFAHDAYPLQSLPQLRLYALHVVLPVHKLGDVKTYWDEFEWFGYPNRDTFRDYTRTEFLAATEGKRRWWLGLWSQTPPEDLRSFDGFDTTMPSFFAIKGLIWQSWGRIESSTEPYVTRLAQNVEALRIALDKIEEAAAHA